MRPAIHEESDDLFESENSSVSSEDENTDIKGTRQKRTPFGLTEQHQAYAFKRATSTMARGEISKHSCVFDSSEDEFSEEE
ncbi:hypothetical protein IRJ41_019881 [Triplophysa rosa]|uniref:Uncharacterized protein n=1 Tax=Triplophysa rosa TaxID=992332 RepID=A0A9W7WWE2_TRIRA|nr:hypothetical protein IRJ41_019881 [Triplophysa rosa]